jgi:hypothetical protein
MKGPRHRSTRRTVRKANNALRDIVSERKKEKSELAQLARWHQRGLKALIQSLPRSDSAELTHSFSKKGNFESFQLYNLFFNSEALREHLCYGIKKKSRAKPLLAVSCRYCIMLRSLGWTGRNKASLFPQEWIVSVALQPTSSLLCGVLSSTHSQLAAPLFVDRSLLVSIRYPI